MLKKRILIEPLLFGEYYIAVYDGEDLLLDKKYYTPDLSSAIMAAVALQKLPRYSDLPIYYLPADTDMEEMPIQQVIDNINQKPHAK